MPFRLARRWYLLLAPVAAVALVYGIGRYLAAPRYEGPPSDHFDGRAFFNGGAYDDRGWLDVIRWKLKSEEVPWPDWRDVADVPPPPARSETLRVTFINHATCLIQLDGINVVTDPVWSDRVGPVSWAGPKRHKRPGVAFDDLPRIDVVVISHNHYDHLDLPSIERLVRRDGPVVIAGLGTRALLERHGLAERAVDLDWWQTHQVGDVRVTFAPAQHWSSRGFGDRRGALWGSYFFAGRTQKAYFAGDTGPGPHFAAIRERLGAPSLALLPIGSYAPRWFMRPQHIDPAEAVAAHVALGATRSMGMHWGTFDQTDEGMDDPANELVAARARADLADTAFVVVDNGGVVDAP